MKHTTLIMVPSPDGMRTYMSLTDEELQQVEQMRKDNPKLTLWDATMLLPPPDTKRAF